jgi:hypothetical protein
MAQKRSSKGTGSDRSKDNESRISMMVENRSGTAELECPVKLGVLYLSPQGQHVYHLAGKMMYAVKLKCLR